MRLGLDESEGPDYESEVDAHYGPLRLIWLAILASMIAIFVVTRLVQPAAHASKMLFWILLAVGVGNFGASFILKHKALKRANKTRQPQLVRGAYIVALALCESIGLLGLIVHLALGIEYYYFFFVLSGFGIILHKPQRDDLLAATRGDNFYDSNRRS